MCLRLNQYFISFVSHLDIGEAKEMNINPSKLTCLPANWTCVNEEAKGDMGSCDEEDCLQTRGISDSESLSDEDDSSSADDEIEDVTTEVTPEADSEVF